MVITPLCGRGYSSSILDSRPKKIMEILQTIFGIVIFGIIGFIIYWVGIVLGVGPEVTKKEINNDPNLK